MTYDCFVFARLPAGFAGALLICGVLCRDDKGDSSDSGESTSGEGARLPRVDAPRVAAAVDRVGGARVPVLPRRDRNLVAAWLRKLLSWTS